MIVAAFNGSVFGLRTSTGERLWKAKVSSSLGAVRLAIHGDLVIALASTLCALDLHTGNEVWQAKVTTAVSEGTIVVSDQAVFVADLGEMAAYDLHTGKQLWYERFPDQGQGIVALALPGAWAQGDKR